MAKKKKKEEDAWWRKYTQPNIFEPMKEIKRKRDDIFSDFFKLFDKTFESLFKEEWFKVPKLFKMEEGIFRRPQVEIKQTNKEILVKVEMPGVKKEDITIKIEDRDLIVDAATRKRKERKEDALFSSFQSYRGYRNVVRLPCSVDKKRSKAKYENGVLYIILPKLKEDKGPSEIEIE